jgi:phytoene dehydrogenase-like protein
VESRFIGKPYKRFRETGPFDAIVVGSGIAGIGIAALLAKAAKRRVLVLGTHYTTGGFAHVFHRPGFEWDVAVHYIGQVHKPGSPAHTLFEYLTEGRLSRHPMSDVYDRVTIDGLRIEYVSGRDAFRDALVRTFSSRAVRNRTCQWLIRNRSNERGDCESSSAAGRPPLPLTFPA